MTTAYPLSWPEGFPRTIHREKGQFRTTLPGALGNLTSSNAPFKVPAKDDLLGSADSALCSTPNFRIEHRSLVPNMQIIEDDTLVVISEDWSRVRSPGRARRRRAKHQQNIEIIRKPSTEVYVIGDRIVCHPATMAALRERLFRKVEEIVERAYFGILRNGNG